MLNSPRNIRWRNVRWWGWGTTDHTFNAKSAAHALNVIGEHLGTLPLPPPERPVSFEALSIPPSTIPEDVVRTWESKGLSLDPFDRLCHAAGKSYRDLIRLRSGTITRYPDAVLFLQTDTDLPQLFRTARAHTMTLVPFGGGTGVVGGTECIGQNTSPIVIVDTSRLNRLLALDELSLTATFEAGILGPDLEAALNQRGYTLGHFPQSFEFSTLGGWIVTRSAGQNSTQYGAIEKLVVSVTLHTPKGVLETRIVPASAAGPSLKEIILGSEGIYGIVTRATVKIHKLPAREVFLTAFFENFEHGAASVRDMMQQGLRPSVIRLSDATETALLLDMKLHSRWQRALLKRWFAFKKLSPAPCLLLISSEGTPDAVAFQSQRMRRVIRVHGGVVFFKNLGPGWKRDRFELPYLRDNLLDHGFLIDTLETATEWSRLHELHRAMTSVFAMREAQSGEKLVIGCHLSHAYVDGASLYFTIIGNRKENPIAQWQEIKTLATTTLIEHGGTLSHHHGIGCDHRPWMEQEKTPLGVSVLRSLKRELDPEGLLNPGKLI